MTDRAAPAIRPEIKEYQQKLGESAGRLRLAKLAMQGFKSFADRTDFTFDAPIVGVVGPNGCGKSNVVDAVKWVLGEQSAKSLRGGAMLDVIFNGSADRKPAGCAEVTLVFANPEGPGRNSLRPLHLEADEVAVTRLLYRDGTSKYRINGRNARLKDIRDLFLDTGVGVDAYSVIEQGRVSQMLEANPAGRRLIFEEAAGISRFKARKKEALQKLALTDTNLARLHDISSELERRLRSVKLAAGKARNYQELSAARAELLKKHVIHEYRSHTAKLADLAARQDEAAAHRDGLNGDLQRKSGELNEKRRAAAEAAADRGRLDREAVQAGATIEQAKQAARHADRQRAELDRQTATVADDRAAAEERRAQVAHDLQQTKSALDGLAADLAARQSLVGEKEQAHRAAGQQQHELGDRIERDKTAALAAMRRLSRAASRLEAIEIERRNAAAQQGRLADRRRDVVRQIEDARGEAAKLAGELNAVAADHAAQQREAYDVHQKAGELGGHIAALADELAEVRERRSALAGRRKVLEDLENHQEGVSAAVRQVLAARAQKYPFVRGLVADVMKVDVEHAAVVEAALSGRDQWLVADDPAAALARVGDLAELPGRVNVVRPDPDAAPPDAVWPAGADLRLASDLVQVEPADRPVAATLLGRTAVVADVETAENLRKSGPTGWRYVTRGGEVVEADGTLRAGKMAESAGILSRRSLMADLARQIDDCAAGVNRLNEKLKAGNDHARRLEEQLNGLRKSIYETNTRKVELTLGSRRVADRIAGLEREQPVLDGELAKLLEQTTALKDERATHEAERAAAERDQAEHEANVARHQDAAAAAAERAREVGEQLTAARVAVGQAQEQHVAAREQARREEARVTELAQQIDRLDRAAAEAGDRRRAIDAEAIKAADAERAATARQAELAEELAEKTKAAEALTAGAKALAADVEATRGRLADVEAQLRDVELKAGERRVRLEGLVARVAEEDGMDLPAEEAAAGEVDDGQTDWAAVAAEIKELRGRISRLGNVNLDAIADQEDLESRQADLAQQIGDVEDAKRQLVELIDGLNAESGKRFEATFEAVREHFQAMFRKLFGGGRADLYLETELEDKRPHQRDGESAGDGPVMRRVDPLDAGIEIIARPPGKQPASISQLSGGEKTMTCIALLMSIFQSKPSPFCILDEVDAALDEANNARFNAILETFLDRSQFIVITHSKRTMRVADLLYGVTMQQQGVSKKVAVKFDDVRDDGRLEPAG